jgi:hypothetical protein
MITKGAGHWGAFHRFLMKSNGRRDCCLQAPEAGIQKWLIDSADGEPKRLTADNPRSEYFFALVECRVVRTNPGPETC